MLTAERLREVLDYEPETGAFIWRISPARCVSAGDMAGCIDHKGYSRIKINGSKYAAHRLAWLYMTEAWPCDQIDHVNTDRADNQWSNLREATNSQNQQNQRCHVASSLKGIHLPTRMRKRKYAREKWVAKIQLDGCLRYLGAFDCPAAAHFAYVVAAERLFGEFARAS